MKTIYSVVLALIIVLSISVNSPAFAAGEAWQSEWPTTDFETTSVDFGDIFSGGPPKDGIPSIDDPSFVPVGEADLPDREPVIGFAVGDDIRAYPLRILM